MISITVYKQSNYPVSAKKIKDAVKKIFTDNGIVSDAEASVAIVNHKTVEKLAIKYLDDTKEEAEDHPVLSFPINELKEPFVFPDDKTIHLGEIVISYQKALEDSKKRNILIDDAVCELATHGALHLIGIHHN